MSDKQLETVEVKDGSVASVEEQPVEQPIEKIKWYRSTIYSATILGLCNFVAPGLWGAMNSLGAGGLEKPYLVNASNALTFGLMFLTCLFGSAAVGYFGIRTVLSVGTAGYAPYAAALYCNSRFGTEWFVILGSALCGLTAGVFWMSEAAIAISYPEPHNKGRLMGYWLCFRVLGQLVGGAINLGVNIKNSQAGGISYHVYQVFIALQATGPFIAWLLPAPSKLQRTDGKRPQLASSKNSLFELKETLRLYLNPKFFLLIPHIAQAVYSEAFMFTYLDYYFSVRARALGSFLSAVCAMISGEILGIFLDTKRFTNKQKARWGYVVIMAIQGGVWIYSTIIQQDYQNRSTRPTFDWASPGFGRGFALYIFFVLAFQVQYLFLYYLIGEIASSPEEVVRLSALLRGTESAAQCVSYGLNSVAALLTIGNSAINFGLWGLSIPVSILIIGKIGVPEGFGAQGYGLGSLQA
nr:MFS.6 [Starmerella bombicola]